VLLTDKAGGLFLATKLPALPPGKVYALWTLAGDVPRAAGVFVPDDGGRAMLKVAPEATSAPGRVLSVTLEPEGGAPAPTGAVVLAPR
jgi:anti-sigma-K factor RskA